MRISDMTFVSSSVRHDYFEDSGQLVTYNCDLYLDSDGTYYEHITGDYGDYAPTPCELTFPQYLGYQGSPW